MAGRRQCGETEASERPPRSLEPGKGKNRNGGAAPTCATAELGDRRPRSGLVSAQRGTRRAPPRGRRQRQPLAPGWSREPRPRPSRARPPLTPPLPFPCTPPSSPTLIKNSTLANSLAASRLHPINTLVILSPAPHFQCKSDSGKGSLVWTLLPDNPVFGESPPCRPQFITFSVFF